jgi:integrase
MGAAWLDAHQSKKPTSFVPYDSHAAESPGVICATTGLRISEVLGLKWTNIDWEKLEMNLARSVVHAWTDGQMQD